MKKIIFTMATIAICSSIALSQQHVVTYYDAFHRIKHEDVYLDNKGEKHGKYVEYYENGAIKEVINYSHGDQNGKNIKYHNDLEYDGRSSIMKTYGIASIMNYKNGQLSGLQQKYYNETEGIISYRDYVLVEELYSNDTLKWKKTYEWNEKTSKRYLAMWEHYTGNKDDKPLNIECYSASGKLTTQIPKTGHCWSLPNPPFDTLKIEFDRIDWKVQGLYREWYSNGQLRDSCRFVDGKQEGIEKTYDKAGRLIKEDVYENGKLIQSK